MLSHSQRLRSILNLTEKRLAALIHQVWFHPRLDALYPEFLFATYGLTLASAPAMRMAATLCRQKAESDPLHRWLMDYYLEHAEEEDGHADWLLEDLASLGIPRERVIQRLPYTGVATLVGAQYYWMQHVHPIAYLGYIAVIETPAQVDLLREVSQRTGIPLSSMSCHYRHAELDPGHVAEFDAALDSLPLTPAHQELITVSAITTIGHLERVFTDILEHFQRIDDPSTTSTIFQVSQPATAALP